MGLLWALLLEEGIEDFGGGDGIKTLFFLSSRKIGSSEFLFSAKSAQSLILEVYGNVNISF